MKLSCPMLVVADMGKSRLFYETVLKQKVVFDFGENVTFNGGFALQSLKLWAKWMDCSPEKIHFGGCAGELYFEEKDFDAFLEHLKNFPDIEYLHPLKTHDWGQRAIRFYDSDEHIIEVGECMRNVIIRFLREGLSIKETSERTLYPRKYVRIVWIIFNLLKIFRLQHAL